MKNSIKYPKTMEKMEKITHNSLIERLQSKKSSWVMVTLILFSLFLCVNLVSAWENTTFNNSLSSENMSFNDNQNITRWIEIPESVSYLTNVQLNLSGYNKTYILSKESYTSGNDNFQWAGNGNNNLYAQTFRTGGVGEKGNYVVNKLSALVWREGDPGTITLSIRNLNASGGAPEGNDLTNGTFIGSSLTTNNAGEWVNVTMDNNFTLIENSEYAVVLTANGSGKVWWNLDSSSPSLPYGNGYDCDDGGATWVTNYTVDMMFRIYGDNETKIQNPYLEVGETNAGYEWNYSGIFFHNNNRTLNIANVINDYISGCSRIGGICYIPFLFHSDVMGLIQYSDLDINNNGFIENSQTYNLTTSEGSTETFIINLTYDPVRFTNIQGVLVYNNTRYIGTKTGIGETIMFIKQIDITPVSVQTDITFYWEIELIEPIGSTIINSTFNEQTVNIISIDDCSANSVLILNFSLKDEESQDVIDSSFYNSSVEIDVQIFPIGSSEVIISYSQNYTKNNNPQICLEELNESYEMDVQVLYDGGEIHVAEFYHIQKGSLSNENIPNNINLFTLKTEDSQDFLITFKDSNFIPVENALINIQRKYIDEGVFKSVEIPKTDEQGQAVGHFDLQGAIYTITIEKNKDVLAIFDNVAVYCEDPIIGNCKINLNALSTGESFSDLTQIGNITYTMSFDKSTRTITTIFSSTDGTSKTVLLNATKFDRFGNQSVCSNFLTTSAGTLTCIIPASYGNLTIIAKLYVNGGLIATRSYSIIPDASDRFGNNGIIMFLLMMMTLPLMMVSSTIAVILGIFIGLILGSLLMIYNNETIIGSTSIIIWAIIAGGIIIWKLKGKR